MADPQHHMSSLLAKVIQSIRANGAAATMSRARSYVAYKLNRRHFEKKVLGFGSPEERFTWIYRRRHWSHGAASGEGSSLKYTENLRRELPDLFRSFGVRVVFDAPCGDFGWIRHVIDQGAVRYIGGDIVRELVESHNRSYRTPEIEFIHVDLTKDRFPPADLMICRDCLFHLSFSDAKAVLRNFADSDIAYLLTTTHVNEKCFENRDITTGDFRLIDLFSDPYNLPRNTLMQIDDWLAPDPKRQMCLWTRKQILESLESEDPVSRNHQ